MEQQRGISISAAALEFELDGHHVTLLDTPGHQDFSEDTYRTLLAVDSVVMVLDAAKGIEPQTRKLFEVCRARGLPVLTFINKLDQPALDPFELLDQIERVLGIAAAPMNWPLGDGTAFAGVYDLEANAVLLYERGARGQRTEPIAVADPHDPDVGTADRRRRQQQLDRRRRDDLRRRHALRHRGVPRRAADAGVLRQRAERLRRRAVPARAHDAGAQPGPAPERRRR